MKANGMRVLLVEDHPELAGAIRDALRRGGFSVDHAGTAEDALASARVADHGLVILDLGLPDEDGLTLLPQLRAGGQVPVIVLTARDQLADRLKGLDGGADDYIVKPVEMAELIARCRAVLRRPGERSDRVLCVGRLELDTVARSASIEGRPIALGRRELGVLEQLMRSAGRVAARALLEEAIYALHEEVTPNALDAAVSRLRRALEAAGSPVPIVTVRGIGWMLPRGDDA